jgi:hypothetical protein
VAEQVPDNEAIHTAADAVRCLYLAQVVGHLGHEDAARRWREKAMAWLHSRMPLDPAADSRSLPKEGNSSPHRPAPSNEGAAEE